MTRVAAAAVFVLAVGVVRLSLVAEAQPPGKVHLIGILFSVSPVSEMAGPEPSHRPTWTES
jgi:hypothetical protein